MASVSPNDGKKKFSAGWVTMLNMIKGGTAGCLATTTVIPLDVVKTWLQLQSEQGGSKKLSLGEAFKSIFKAKGFRGFYSGLDAALVRQFCFASVRVGLFFNAVTLMNQIKKRNFTFIEKMCVSASFGTLGAFLINPFDVVMVRAWGDVKKPPEQRYNYNNIFNGLVRITREEGIKTLWRAATPNIFRAIGLNVGMMSSFQECSERLKPYLGDTFTNNAISSVIAGFCATLLALPFDNIKVKLVNMKPDASGNMPYKGVMHCLAKSVGKEGIHRLWAGLIPVTLNLGPHSIITLLAAVQINKFFVSHQLLP